MFLATHTFKVSTPIPAGVTEETMMSVIQDYENMFKLQPLIVKSREVPVPDTEIDYEDPHFKLGDPMKGYIITDRLQIIPGIDAAHTFIDYPALLQTSADGVRSLAHAAAGVVVKGFWHVERASGSEDGLVLVEDTVAEAFVLLMPFVKNTMETAHRELSKKLVDFAAKNSG